MTEEKRFRRLLRWYPRAWRQRNGEVLVGTMLDDAEAQGRNTPSLATRMSVIGYGLGTRLDGRLAIAAALLSLVAAVLGSILLISGSTWLEEADLLWMLPVLNAGISPALVAVGIVSIARQRGLVSEPRAVGVVALAVLAFAASALAQLSWNEGFDAADAGIAQSSFAAAWGLLFAAGLAFGAAAIALLAQALLRLACLGAATSIPLASLVGLMLAPAIGIALMTMMVAPVIAPVALTLATLLPIALRSRPSPASHRPAGAASKAAPARMNLARVLASCTAVASTASIAFALTGSWWPGKPDATEAMGLGIAILMLSALPLIAGIGVVVAARRRVGQVHTWGPLALIALACTAIAVSYLGPAGWSEALLVFAIPGFLSGAAIAWWLLTLIPGAVGLRTTIAVAVGLASVVSLNFFLILLAFGLPVVAVLFIFLVSRAPRARPSDFAAAGAVPQAKRAA